MRHSYSRHCLNQNLHADSDIVTQLPAGIHKVSKEEQGKPVVVCTVDGKDMQMEFDSGSAVTVISQDTWLKLNLKTNLVPSDKGLRVANGHWPDQECQRICRS